jgi:ADP-ribosylglycohydrolase
MHTPREDQYTGCLIGQCLGDALGFPVEGRSQPRCKQYVDEVLREDRVVEVKRGPFRFGQYSDDSQLARELLLSYTKKGIFDPADYAERIAALFTQNRIVGRGRATEQATFHLHQGIAWDQAGTPAPEAGNGSAMRAGAISGAWLGLGRIPAKWSKHLNDQGSWSLEELTRLAEKTYRMSVNADRGG